MVTAVSTTLLFWQLIGSIVAAASTGHPLRVFEQTVFGLIALCVIYGSVVYQCTRIGYMRRLMSHVPATPEQLDRLFLEPAPTLTILVPSYKEDPDVVRRTLLSAALQQYPGKRVVLLIDDPAGSGREKDRFLRKSVERLPVEIQELMDAPAREFGALASAFLDRQRERALDPRGETRALARAHAAAAEWLEQQAGKHPGTSHSDVLFVNQMFRESSHEHSVRASELEDMVRDGGPYPDPRKLLADYRRLAARFHVTITSFQRRRYRNLSHEANKAMNLNSYIGLLGGRYDETAADGGLLLLPSTGDAAMLDIPASDYIITLDADSILAPDYAVRLTEFAERPVNARLAVVQTPYSAEPDPPGLVERVAGATTDMQYLIHQGFTHFNATFWVGANALLRTEALQDICVEVEERGFRVKRFIQDRTVIEDTESSVDLVAKGWKLHNYPERLSHSATPPDFGSLLIQRGRWANGGLIIVPKLLQYLSRGRFLSRASEGFFRLHYLVSIAMVNIAVPVMLLCPFEQDLHNLWFPLTCLPYYLLYGRDLLQAGYRVGDLFRVYAMNL
ncbi:MAG TPA: glycosyltransferase family 2 protein, partial [Thermoanaerobaculia bacterium]